MKYAVHQGVCIDTITVYLYIITGDNTSKEPQTNTNKNN